LADVTPAVLAEARDRLLATTTKRGQTMTPAYVVRHLAALSHCLTIAMKEYGWVESNPVLKVTKPKEPRGRIRFLSDDERERLLAACRASASPDLYPAVVLALSTGARQQEVMGLRWPQIDLARRVAILHETKNGERRVLPLAGPALELLRERVKVRRLDTDLVFPGRQRRPGPDGKPKPPAPVDLRAPFEMALTRAEITDFRWHDLRHTAASYLAMNGASLAEIAEVLGHKTLAMVRRYAHLSEAHTASVVERMNARYFGEVAK
jgi:integrase